MTSVNGDVHDRSGDGEKKKKRRRGRRGRASTTGPGEARVEPVEGVRLDVGRVDEDGRVWHSLGSNVSGPGPEVLGSTVFGTEEMANSDVTGGTNDGSEGPSTAEAWDINTHGWVDEAGRVWCPLGIDTPSRRR